ncbi:hypothetical protein [Sediminibacterium ginsengisoli]|uniref:Uncharacterized protein n=1 Tax=Sediminibacterium ginsengisoli TaxID=413434 RepID=A0A1T4NWZ0_9BACT|nr:hypothetical protein [Sediminibacterium ginsengisoli]SJZ83870.1 hypothetical protein SAMN04488132_10538 [Sediminibacterium ginsengisoli]
MKWLLHLLLAGMFFTSCSDKKDVLWATAPGPELSFSSDILRVREKDYTNINNTRSGMITISAIPAIHQLNLLFNEPTGKVHFSYRGEQLKESIPFVVPSDDNELYCSVDTPGMYSVDFYLTDQLGRVASKRLLITCIASERPIAQLEYQLSVFIPDSWLYLFNASGSRQPAGLIMAYRYIINGQLFNADGSWFQYYFHQPGDQQVSFYVIDDLGRSSDTLHYSINVR